MSTPDPMAEIRASFFIECEELLESLQDGLETMAEDTGDLETINVVFRAVHSIKGGAGAFGLEGLVRFAHRYETVLDAVRSNTLVADGDAIKLFFRAADHLSDLVRESRDEGVLPEAEGNAILTELDALLGDHWGLILAIRHPQRLRNSPSISRPKPKCTRPATNLS